MATGSTGTPQQGASVALSADGNTVITGGFTDNTNIGAAWVFTRSAGVWTQQGSKLVGTGVGTTPLQGVAVALSADGNTAAVGGNGDSSEAGATWVFTRSGGVWSQQGGKLVGTGAVGNADQGQGVALSADGNTLLAGGFADNTFAGATWVFTRTAGVWTQKGSKLVGTGASGTFSRQGYSVSLADDGNTAVVGAWGDNSFAGAAWVFVQPPPTVVTLAATSVTVGGARLNATVNPNGSSTTARFDYGPTLAYGTQATASPAPGAGTSPVAVSAVITGLGCNTLHHFRAVGIGAGTTNGADLTFTTAACTVPTITTQPNNQTIPFNTTATLSVIASGGGLSYQWHHGQSGDTTRPIGGATADTHMPTLISNTNFWVLVSNAAGTANSNTALVTVTFTDSLVAGTTTIKAVHINEPRARIDAARVFYGLLPAVYANTITAGSLLRALDIAQTQTALAQAYAAAILPPPTFSTSPTIGGTPVVADIQDLRDKVQVIEK